MGTDQSVTSTQLRRPGSKQKKIRQQGISVKEAGSMFKPFFVCGPRVAIVSCCCLFLLLSRMFPPTTGEKSNDHHHHHRHRVPHSQRLVGVLNLFACALFSAMLRKRGVHFQRSIISGSSRPRMRMTLSDSVELFSRRMRLCFTKELLFVV